MAEVRTILVVDDTQEDRDLLSEILEDDGYEVITEDDGARAVKRLQSGDLKPDLILMDMSMPEMSGHTAISLVKADENLKSIPFIFVTGKDRTQDLLESQMADDFVTKPYDADNLLMRIRKVLSRYT
ncbi:MAG: response regulator [Candidatus Omnitrophica bacterium]|nr:response regulator [Candidatus Omnitrophota bacterium]